MYIESIVMYITLGGLNACFLDPPFNRNNSVLSVMVFLEPPPVPRGHTRKGHAHSRVLSRRCRGIIEPACMQKKRPGHRPRRSLAALPQNCFATLVEITRRRQFGRDHASNVFGSFGGNRANWHIGSPHHSPTATVARRADEPHQENGW